MPAMRKGLLMTHSEHAPGYVPNPDYSQEDWDEVSDTPELTDTEIAELRPNGEGLPLALAEAFKRLAGRPKSEAKAVPVSLRVRPMCWPPTRLRVRVGRRG